MSPMSTQTQTIHRLALTAHFGLMLWVIMWQLIFSPHPHLNPWIMTSIWLVPLLPQLRGMLKALPYTHAWANFILMFYFLHALTILAIDQGERWLAAIEFCLVSMSFIGNILFTRQRGRELGIKLKRLSQVELEEREKYQQ